MLGLSKKKEETKQGSPAYLVLVNKWDGFLEKIEIRFNESLHHAEEAVMDNLVESDYDMSPTERTWSGIKSQLMGLSEKIEKTFDEKVKPQMLEYKEDWEVIDEDQKGVKLGASIYHRIERFEIEMEGKVAQKFYKHAIQFLNEDFHCTQCSAKLAVKKDIFRAHYVSCYYCNAVNTFTPSDKIAEIGWVVENIAKHNAIDEWDEKNSARSKCKEFRSLGEEDDKTELTKAYEKWEIKEHTYWTKFFKERAAFLPEFEETIVHDVDVKMKRYFYDDRKRSDLKF